jgi:hypothetical protein
MTTKVIIGRVANIALRFIWVWTAIGLALTLFQVLRVIVPALSGDPEAIGGIAAYIVIAFVLVRSRRRLWQPAERRTPDNSPQSR